MAEKNGFLTDFSFWSLAMGKAGVMRKVTVRMQGSKNGSGCYKDYSRRENRYLLSMLVLRL